MARAPTLTEALASPSICPQGYDPITDTVRLVQLRPELFRSESFMDDRLLKPGVTQRSVPFATLNAAWAAAAPAPAGCGLIFHLGHTGSTLLSRLLGAHERVLPLREPAGLKTLAELAARAGEPESLFSQGHVEVRLSLLMGLWSRTYEPGQLAVVKATSICCEISARLLRGAQARRAIALISEPRTYLAVMLGSASGRMDLRCYASDRLRRLHRRLRARPWRMTALSAGEICAMSWATEMCALATGAAAAGPQLRWLEFDRLLARPAGELARAFDHLGLAVAADEVEAIVSGPVMREYSKSPDLAFDPQLRQRRTSKSLEANAEEISRGLAWLEAAARDHSQIREAVEIGRTVAAGESAGAA
jgi:hypothetical protein